MTTCQTAANEFLRQFWLTIYPPPADAQLAAVATPAQKAAKAAKMIGYLERTHEKVDALVHAARQNSVDPARVQTASPYFVSYHNQLTHPVVGHETNAGCRRQGNTFLAISERFQRPSLNI